LSAEVLFEEINHDVM